MEGTSGKLAPRILSRPEHVISRKNIDADALRVLYRLRNSGFVAYLVGGGVRDLLLSRQPKDFDIGTSAHPQQVRKLFRNCFIVGRRFRLAHVRFGRKVIEVSTFRRMTAPDEGDTLVRRDNTFGSPEEDAFRRDFTVNALFYDIATFSVIDWVGGLEDLQARLIRSIGDPGVRFREDPVRMLRAVALAARLDFTIERDTAEAVRAMRGEIVRSSPARILEEFYKILRQGRSRTTFQMLHEYGLLAYLLPEADRVIETDGGALLESLGRLDEHRLEGRATPDQLTNPLLMGALLVPLDVPLRRVAFAPARPRVAGVDPHEEGVRFDGEASIEDAANEATLPEGAVETDAGVAEAVSADAPRDDVAAELQELGVEEDEAGAEPVSISLPFARRDIERLRLILMAQRRLREAHPSPSSRRSLAARAYFDEALRWLEIHGGPDGRALAAEWRQHAPAGPAHPAASGGPEPRAAHEPHRHERQPGVERQEDGRQPPRRRRRRRRRPPNKPAPPA